MLLRENTWERQVREILEGVVAGRSYCLRVGRSGGVRRGCANRKGRSSNQESRHSAARERVHSPQQPPRRYSPRTAWPPGYILRRARASAATTTSLPAGCQSARALAPHVGLLRGRDGGMNKTGPWRGSTHSRAMPTPQTTGGCFVISLTSNEGECAFGCSGLSARGCSGNCRSFCVIGPGSRPFQS